MTIQYIPILDPKNIYRRFGTCALNDASLVSNFDIMARKIYNKKVIIHFTVQYRIYLDSCTYIPVLYSKMYNNL